ncbi:MAG: LLM class flavin-dependent oxidoreductase [Bacteroidetes bacterium]|nr:LLM class flavin-dependent oxidoreductase [Bacteroidota bacterium]
MELGIYSFVEIPVDANNKPLMPPAERMRNLMEEITLADQLGLDVFALGEHHRPEYLVSSPAVVLAAAAAVTKNIRLSSAVTVISSDDPVRVYQDFATVDLLSNGRAEIMAGRGSFIESFPLFGYDLQKYDSLFQEKLEMLMKIQKTEQLTWSGRHRPAIDDLGIYPRSVQPEMPIWVAVGGTPESVVRAAVLGLPMAIAIIGGTPDRFEPFAELYRSTWKNINRDPKGLKLSINSHGFIAEDAQAARDLYYPPYAEVMGRIGRERNWPPPSRARYDAECSPHGALFVGSPQQIIDKILYEYELFRHDRFLIQFSVGTMPHDKMMKCIELFGTQVAPVIRKALQAQDQ